MIPLVAPKFFDKLPHALQPLLESGILLASISAVALNLWFNGLSGDGREAAAKAGRAAEHA